MRLRIQPIEITGTTVLFPHWDILTVQRLLEVKFSESYRGSRSTDNLSFPWKSRRDQTRGIQ